MSSAPIQRATVNWTNFPQEIRNNFQQIYSDWTALPKSITTENRTGITWKVCAAGAAISAGAVAVVGVGVLPIALAIAFFGGAVVSKVMQNNSQSLIGRVKKLDEKPPLPAIKFNDFTDKMKLLYKPYMKKLSYDYEHNQICNDKEACVKRLRETTNEMTRLESLKEQDRPIDYAETLARLTSERDKLDEKIHSFGDIRHIRHSQSVKEFLEAHHKEFPVTAEQWKETAMRFFAMRCTNMVKKGGGELLERALNNDAFFDYSTQEPFKPGEQIHVIGDIQGGVGGLINYLTQLNMDNDWKLPAEAPHIVFIGDYTDGSVFGHEVWYLLMELSLQNPDKVTMIKGNHEVADLSNHDEFGYKLSDRDPSHLLTWKKENFGLIHSLAAVLPSLLLAKNDDKIAWFSHSWDPKAFPELRGNEKFSEIHYQNIELEDLTRHGAISMAQGTDAAQCLSLPDGRKPGDGFGVNKSLLSFRTEVQDLVSAFGDGACFFTPKVLEACRANWIGGNKIQNMNFGHVSEPTHADDAQGIAWQQMKDGCDIRIVDASFDDIATARYLIPAQVYEAVDNGWLSKGRHIIRDIHGFYQGRPIEKRRTTG